MQLTTILVRQGAQSVGEDWETLHDYDAGGAGIGILKRKSKSGWELLVEFKVEGIVWRRCLVGVLDPTNAGVQHTIPQEFLDAMVSTLTAFYTSEINGGSPLLTLATIMGNNFIPPLRSLAPPAFEVRQQKKIENRDEPFWNSMSFQDIPAVSLEYPPDEEDTQDYVPPEDKTAFDNWGWADDDEDNEG